MKTTEKEGKHYLESICVTVQEKPPEVEVREFVVTRLTKRGEGTKVDPIRIVTEVWDKGGQKIGEVDPITSNK